MRIEELEEMIKEMESHVQPIRNPTRLLPPAHITDQDDWYRQQALRSTRTPLHQGRVEEEPQTSIFVDEETGHVGRFQIMRGPGHEGAVEFC